MIEGIIGTSHRRADPEVPIQPFRDRFPRQGEIHRGKGARRHLRIDCRRIGMKTFGADETAQVAPQGKGGFDLSQSARPDKVASPSDHRVCSVLAAVLKDPVIAAHRLHELTAFVNGDRDGLFAVHILSGFYGMDGHGAMPVVRRDDDHGVNVVPCKQFTIIIIGGAPLVGPVLRPVGIGGCQFRHAFIEAYFIYIAECNYFDF
ncbi:MAG: hypothetical protein BWY09_03203 [Candidatus Hydrogenedentes bacterium ADurb.Bin179]|nr:MAG: hypothetical protein BWY09_03203 [Candidatus Hydrogenedentes bacterium ADurb.Bin179]